MRKKTALTKNVMKAAAAFNNLEAAANAGSPAIGIFSGKAGNGKTTAGGYLFVNANGLLVRCLKADTLGTFLERLAAELGIDKRHRKVDMINFIVNELSIHRNPLFIDEADYLADRTEVLETIRDIYDLANIPIILIGYEKLPTKIKKLPQLYSRVAEHVTFEKADLDDIQVMSETLVEHTQLSDDLLTELLTFSRGNFRDIHTGLVNVEKYAKTNELKDIDINQWGDQPFIPKAQ